MSVMTLQLPTPLTPTQITNQGVLMVAALNNASSNQSAQTTAIATLNTQLTSAQTQRDADLNGDPQVLARDVLQVASLRKRIVDQTAFYDALIANSTRNANLLALNLARGFTLDQVDCTVDLNGIVTRNDTGQIVPGIKITPPPKS